MPLGMEVDLGPGHCARWRPSSPPRERGTATPLFSAHVYCDHGRPSQLLLSFVHKVTENKLAALQAMARCCKLPCLYKPALITMTSFAIELGMPSVTDVRYIRTDTLLHVI